MSSKICIGCNIEFIPKWSKAVYCSISCSKKGYRNPTWKGEAKIHICPSCKKEFLPKHNIHQNHIFCSKKCSKIGGHNPQWKGDNVGYAALHTWVGRNFPKPDKCSNCNTPGEVEAANISGKYKRDISDWEWLCRKCHMGKDGRINNLLVGDIKRKHLIPPQELRKVNPHLLTP